MLNYPLIPFKKNAKIRKLEQHFQFNYLPTLSFESEEDRQDVFNRGMLKLNNQQINQKAQRLGKRYWKSIQSGYLPKVSVRWIDARVGYGLFAEEELAQETYFGEYTGIVRKNDRLYFEPLNDYCYEYPVPDSIGRSFVIDATQGNLTRFINHSFSPNLKPMHVFYQGFYHLIFLTLRPIHHGEQLFYDYGQNYWYLRQSPSKLT
jgi:SET domain-containing protein